MPAPSAATEISRDIVGLVAGASRDVAITRMRNIGEC